MSSSNTVIFSVGGRRFEISWDLLNKYPQCLLTQQAKSACFARTSLHSRSPSADRTEVFLDHNPDAFSCILDYLRYGGRLLVPRSVCREVVLLQLRQLNLPVDPQAVLEDTELPSYQDATGSSVQGSGTKSPETIMIKKLTDFSILVLKPLIIKHARSGNLNLDVWLTEEPVRREQVATTIDTDRPHEWIALKPQKSESSLTQTTPSANLQDLSLLSAIESSLDQSLSDDQRQRIQRALRKHQDFSSSEERVVEHSVTLSFLLQPEVFGQLQKTLIKLCSVQSVSVERKDLTVRRENEFGLLESRSIIAVFIRVHL